MNVFKQKKNYTVSAYVLDQEMPTSDKCLSFIINWLLNFFISN